ncbi:MAG TPA: hypothetical protein VFA84_10315 [Acidimicrobiales bacterium]|nr:hypothetical protein [Acidimicrobiales bacterium]
MGKLTGLLRELTGALTGDRRTEARGRAETKAAHEGAPVTDASVERDLDAVREQQGDIRPREGPPPE